MCSVIERTVLVRLMSTPLFRDQNLSRSLDLPGDTPRIIAPTTIRKMAERLLSASCEIAAFMPRGFHGPCPLDILLALYIAEDDADYLQQGDLTMPGALSPASVGRWTAALLSEGLIEQRNMLLGLSDKGHALVTSTIEAIYLAQRALD